jgi:hypothetical protein
VAVALGFESLLEDKVAIGVESNHDILVAGVCSDGEATSVTGKELLSGFVMTKTWLEGIKTGGGGTRGTGKVDLGFVDRKFLALLGKMAHDCLIGIRTVPGCIGVGEALEVVVVAGFDSVEPSLLDRETKAGMIESNLSTNAGEIKAAWVKWGTCGLGSQGNSLGCAV